MLLLVSNESYEHPLSDNDVIWKFNDEMMKWFGWNYPCYHFSWEKKAENCDHCFDYISAYNNCTQNGLRKSDLSRFV